jgi:hypothetical protein
MVRWLAPQLVGPQRWVLHDRDAELLERAAEAGSLEGAGGHARTLETRLDDITRLAPNDLAGACLLTASALLDMFTEADLSRFVATCAAAGCPVLITLSVVGRVELAPADPFDPLVLAAFNAHQRRRTPHGRLLGPDAAAAAVDGFVRRGRDVLVRPSPWRLGAEDCDLAAAWLTGWLDAACEQEPELAEHLRPYGRRRLAAAAAGSLTVTVEHQDMLVLGSR